MLLRDFLPHARLREFIQWYRICHFEFAKAAAIPVKPAAPKPENILHFFLRDFWAIQKPGEGKNVQPSVVFVGQRTQLTHQFNGSDFLNVQIVFQPTAVFRITGIPATEFTNQHIDATLLFGSAVQTILDKLRYARGYDELLTIIEDFAFQLVRDRGVGRSSVHAITRRMIAQGGNNCLDKLADDACLSIKQFQRLFYQAVGVNPKTYSRIIRMTRAYNLKNAYPQKDWLDIAIACGYYDYQHMVKDYKDFTGVAPTEFLTLEGQTPERVLGLADQLYKDRAKPIVCD